jgi:glutaredoxin 2
MSKHSNSINYILSVVITMMLYRSSTTNTIASVQAWSNTWKAASAAAATTRTSTSLSSSTSSGVPVVTTASAPVLPSRVVLPTLPTIYVYDHCPFCVRVRLALGMKNIKHKIHFMANDDVATPTSLVGKKIAPIFEYTPLSICMAESMDIIQLIDNTNEFGPIQMIQPSTDRTDIQQWQKSVQSLLRDLQRPRYVNTGLLPEFHTADGRYAFIRNHPIPPYEKSDWKNNYTLETQLLLYQQCMLQDPQAKIAQLNEKLIELDDMIYSDWYCSNTNNGFSYDDIDLWSRLRSITIIKNVQWPSKLRNYMDHLSQYADVPLYDAMAQ